MLKENPSPVGKLFILNLTVDEKEFVVLGEAVQNDRPVVTGVQ